LRGDLSSSPLKFFSLCPIFSKWCEI
jgi:hypothetical protein